MKRITLEELEKKLRAESYERLCTYVYSQIENGRLKPVKASKTNGKKPALYREYWGIEPDKNDGIDLEKLKEELKYGMSAKISVDYYMKHLDQYASDRRWVLMLNDYLRMCQGMNEMPVISKNERSFQIWGREKFLQLEQGKKILKRCGMDVSQLSFYETSEPLAYYSRERSVPQNLLILENKDTFYSMRRHLIEGGERIFGIPFGTLIYGAGKGILRSFQDFAFCVEPYMREDENTIFYFGDLDYEGIGIFERLAESFEMPIRPFAAAYEQMMDKAGAVLDLPETKEKQNRRISGKFYEFFSDAMVCKMKELLESGRYIPQEILNIEDFKNRVY